MNQTKTCIFLFLFSFLFSPLTGNSQSLLNGDFENHTEASCNFNMTNVAFNASMQNVTAFGSNNEVDIQTEGCGIFPTISNDWYLSLSQRPTGAFDQISLEIDQPLTAGITYQLSYFELADTSSNPVTFNSNMPIEIGLSSDSTSFGDFIYSSTPDPDVWTMRAFEFVAPNNGQYITIRMAGDFGLRGWNFVDNFQLSPWTSTKEAAKLEANIFPNPVRDWLNIETEFAVQSIQMFNAMGQLVKSVPQVDAFYNRVDMSWLVAGVYFLEIIGEQGRMVERVEKI